MGQNFVGQDVTAAISLGQEVVGQEVLGQEVGHRIGYFNRVGKKIYNYCSLSINSSRYF